MYCLVYVLNESVYIKPMMHMTSVDSDLYHSNPYTRDCVCKAGAAQCQRGFIAV